MFETEWVERALSSQVTKVLKGNSPIGFHSIETDSRNQLTHCLFVALKGETHDAHDHIASAVENGAKGVLCSKSWLSSQSEIIPNVIFFGVDEPLQAFRALARAWRLEFQIPILGVAGSVGKTTTKEFLAAILSSRWNVLKTHASENGFIGIPMTLLKLRKGFHQAAVVEIGIDEPGTMLPHLKVINPTGGVLTAIGPEHLEKLIDLPTVAKEESSFLLFLAQNAQNQVVVNLDDPLIQPIETLLKYPYWSFSLSGHKPIHTSSNHVTAQWKSKGHSLTIQFGSSSPFEIELPLPGEHHARNLLCAVTLALSVGLSAFEIAAGLQSFQGATGRTEILPAPWGGLAICDYYNANPTSMKAALSLTTDIQSEKKLRRKIAALGDMLELGPQELQYHEDLAGDLMSFGFDEVCLLGQRMKSLHNRLLQLGGKKVFHFSNTKEMTQHLLEVLDKDSLLLIKGSRGMKMERIWQDLNSKQKS